MLGLNAILETRAPGFSLAAEGQMLLVLADLARLAGPRARVDMAAKTEALSWAEAAAEFIQTNHHRAIGVGAVAAYVGFHPSHLGRLFKAHYGTTVQVWLARTRIERAKLLLRTTDRPVSEVARSVGYRDYAPFEKRFKALAGRSPTEYRKGEFFT
jgi:AraC-like DNA-binding protein